MSNYEPYTQHVAPSVAANLIRILLVAATVLGFGAPIIVYVAAWLMLPEGA